jgi:bifunctional non-homologous end joining protein LigD
MPTAISPMKAEIAERPPRGDDWLFEIKWDGVRAIAFIEGEEVRLQSRSGLRCERQYPELAVLPHYVGARSAILDGEIAVLDPKGVSRFHLIQPRIANTTQYRPQCGPPSSISFLTSSIATAGTYNVAGRKQLGGPRQAPVRLSQHFAGMGREMLDSARETPEGILAKAKHATRAGADW